MIKKISPLILLSSLFLALCVRCQTTAEIKNVDFAVQNDSMIITYDIMTKTSGNERFFVSMLLKTTSGKVINPQTIMGDIGKNVKAGNINFPKYRQKTL